MQDVQGPRTGSPGDAEDRQGLGLHRGEVDFGGSGKKRGKFVRVLSGVAPSVLFDLLLAEWHLPAPNLVVSLVGEEQPFAMKSWLRDVLRKGLVKVAQSTGEPPPSRHAPTPHSGLREDPAAGPSPSCLLRAQPRLPEWAQEDIPVHYPEDDGSSQGPLCPLDSNLSHFILVEPGPPGKGDGLTELRLRLEKHISEQRTGYGGTGSIEIPVLCLLVNGDPSTLERISRAVEQAAPWLILAGSGGIADVLAALVNQPHLLVPRVAEKQFKEKFPSEHFSWEDIVRWTKLLQNITSHQHLLTVYDFEQEGSEELDTVILKALVKACKSHSQEPQDYLDELKLAVAWDHVDIAKSEIFNGDVEWKVPPSLVSRVLKDFLQDACRGFYQDGRPGGRRKAEKGPAKQPTGQKWLLDLNQKSENPWRDLFLWAVLQNRHEMATYFWAMGQEGVAAALAACKILKEMSHLETEAEAARAMREAKYEQLALDLFSECYSNSEDLAFALLVRRNRCWSKTTCLHLATEADAKAFFAHDGVQAFLTRIWWGDMAAGTPILRLLGAFFCPALVYTNLITFSEEASLRTGLEDLQELDSLDTEKSLLCGLRSRCEAEGRADLGPGHRWNPDPHGTLNPDPYRSELVQVGLSPARGPGQLSVDCLPPSQGFFTDEDTHLLKKFTLYVGDNWNKCDMVAIFLFIVGVTCRMLPLAFEAGRTVLAMDFMVFTLRLIHIFAIHKQLGPKIIVVERMMKDVFFFLFFLSVWLVAYGVTTQALLHPHDGRLEWIFRRVLYRPYLQIFGQIPLDEIDEARVNCSTHPLLLEDSPSCPSLYANWLVILLLVTFLLVTNVLLMNLLIAMFSYTFQVVQGNADMFWKFQRYNLIVEYHERPALAPPFILLSHLSLALRRVFKKEAEHKREHLERDLPDPLDQKVITWETVQKENFLSKMEKRKRDSEGEVLRKTANRLDFVAKYLGGLREQEKRIKHLESQINYCSVLVSSVADMLAQGGSPWTGSRHCGGGSRLVASDHRGGLDGQEQPGAGQPSSDT
uniref:Transient receptor potential cation channel subfamily M member 5 n=1 Tax=Mandrillus leucophaeus TaxID=9568 RepID=A0A2K5Y8W8_MANLE